MRPASQSRYIQLHIRNLLTTHETYVYCRDEVINRLPRKSRTLERSDYVYEVYKDI